MTKQAKNMIEDLIDSKLSLKEVYELTKTLLENMNSDSAIEICKEFLEKEDA